MNVKIVKIFYYIIGCSLVFFWMVLILTPYMAVCCKHAILLTPNNAVGQSLGWQDMWRKSACQRYATMGVVVACLWHAYHTLMPITPTLRAIALVRG